MKFLLLLTAFLTAQIGLGVEYQTFCEVRAGKANGYVAVISSDSLIISGYVVFNIYDEDGDLIDEEDKYEYSYIYHGTELVSEIDADEDARFCAFDISAAVIEE